MRTKVHYSTKHSNSSTTAVTEKLKYVRSFLVNFSSETFFKFTADVHLDSEMNLLDCLR